MLDRRTLLAGAALSLAPRAVLAAATQGDTLHEDLERLRTQHGLPALAAAVVRNGVIVASGVAGVRVHGTAIKATIEDRFHLGSDTKAMTATLAGMMVDEGKLGWGSTIGEILGAKVPGLNPKLAAVTLEQLLSHSSGIPSDTEALARLYFNTDEFEYNLPGLRLRALKAWRSHAPVTKPGSTFHYANFGYLIAGAMIETAAGAPWEELITTRIFTPLGLSTAGLGPQATRGKYDAPVGHTVDEKGVITPVPWGAAADVPPILGPAGVAHMSILDFAQWAAWNAGRGKCGPALVKPETLAEVHRPRIKTGKLPNARPGTPQEGEYAFGWGVVKFDWTQTPVLQHNGSNGKNLAKILVDCEKNVGVVVTTNFPEDKAEAAAGAAMETLYKRYA